MKTESFGYALTDATKSIELDKNYVKGFYRRAAANMALGKWKEALKDYEYVSCWSLTLFIVVWFTILKY